jgi:hypothetical protein
MLAVQCVVCCQMTLVFYSLGNIATSLVCIAICKTNTFILSNSGSNSISDVLSAIYSAHLK